MWKSGDRRMLFYCLYELVIFAINPFKNIAIGYVRRDTVIAKYSYDMKPLYDMHLVFHMRWWEWYSYSF